MRFAIPLFALFAAATPVMAATTFSFEGPALLQFDQLYYPMSPGTLTVDNGTFTVAAPAAMTNCRRASGLAQTASTVRVQAGATTIHLDETVTDGAKPPAQLRREFGLTVVRFLSRTGDLVCDGSVVPAGAEAIYADGFE